MNEQQAFQILGKVLEFSQAEHVTASLQAGDRFSARFAENSITQNVGVSETQMMVETAFGQCHGVATTGDLGDDSLKAAVKRAEDIAKVSPSDPEYVPPVDASETEKYKQVKEFYPETAGFDPVEKGRMIGSAVETVKKEGFRISGAFANQGEVRAIANSAGLKAFHRQSSADVHATVLTPTSSGWATSYASRVEDLKFDTVVGNALDVARNAQEPQDVEPGKYTLVMPAAALADIVKMILMGFDAKAVDEERAFLRGKVGQKVFGENITMRSDPAEQKCPAMPFQADGLAAPEEIWIDKGVVKNTFYSRYWAKKQGKQATGRPTNIIIDGGDTSVDEMIASTEKGILATRFWYIRYVDPMIPLITGMTRDGLFLIEDGKVSKPIKNLRFNVDMKQVLSNVTALGPTERLGGYFDMLMPSVKVENFNFTSGTKF